MKKIYKIPVTFEMYGVMEVEAASLEEAKRLAIESEPLPEEKHYVDDSCQVNEEYLECLIENEEV
jgi:hypothetical protein